jgi:menaquinone reductase, multiheme cytochrome c subunit
MTVRRDILVFGCGVALATVIGWLVFPHALYVRSQQPVNFQHKLHGEKSGITKCDACHAFGSDGRFAGTPPLATCAGCHGDKIGTSKSEAMLVDTYIKQGRDVAWPSYSRQPANVWFSHAIHVRRAGLACAACHGPYGESDQQRVYARDRVSSYSRDVSSHGTLGRASVGGMTMSDCESCHRRRNVEVGCAGCHQ